jgi:hypothetical protein
MRQRTVCVCACVRACSRLTSCDPVSICVCPSTQAGDVTRSQSTPQHGRHNSPPPTSCLSVLYAPLIVTRRLVGHKSSVWDRGGHAIAFRYPERKVRGKQLFERQRMRWILYNTTMNTVLLVVTAYSSDRTWCFGQKYGLHLQFSTWLAVFVLSLLLDSE